MYGSPNDTAKFKAFAQSRFNMLSPNSHGPDRVGLSGPDVAEPEEHLRLASKSSTAIPRHRSRCGWPCPPTSRPSSPGAPTGPFSRASSTRFFRGSTAAGSSSRSGCGSWNERVAHRGKAERPRRLAGSPADLDGLWAAWEPVLFNQTHDLASGVMTDHVYEDTIRSYEFSKRRAEAIIDANWDVL